MSLTGYLLLAMSSLFVIVNLIAAVPAFIAMTFSYGILRISVHGARWLSPLALKLLTRLMGLLLAAVAVQFAINGLEQTALFKR
jgi:small neutral amino acid transporter SnatA (MarC family)